MKATRCAFKEWRAVCRALGTGVQTVVLRKGGIAEPPGGFLPDRSEFVLVPTAFHQTPAALKPEQARLVEPPSSGPDQGEPVLVEYAATLVEAYRIASEADLEAIRDEHVWSDEVVRERLHRGPERGLYGLVLRVRVLSSPAAVRLSAEQLGCKSWIDLATPIPLDGARAVLSDDDFERRRARIASKLRAGAG
jgi:hypothetical protein